MSDPGPPAFGAVSPVELGWTDPGFGLLFPGDHGVSFSKPTGGDDAAPATLTGTFLPLDRPRANRGLPGWCPVAPSPGRPAAAGPETPAAAPGGGDGSDGGDEDGVRSVADVDLASIPARDREALPGWVRDRGHFHGWEELYRWLESDAVPWYGRVDLLEELADWHAASGGTVRDRDVTRDWDGVGAIWAAVDADLDFTYEVLAGHDREGRGVPTDPAGRPLPASAPAPTEGVVWVRIEGSKERARGGPRAPWAETLSGAAALLLYPTWD